MNRWLDEWMMSEWKCNDMSPLHSQGTSPAAAARARNATGSGDDGGGSVRLGALLVEEVV